ncbi:nucleotide exchange factor GrpE [Schinkia sp. CFF1]
MVDKDYSQKEENTNEENATRVAEESITNEVGADSIEQQIDEQQEHVENIEDAAELTNEQQEIERLQQELEEKQNRILRMQADFENYRRRVRLDEEAAVKYRAQSLIENILPALDNFERALNIEAKEDETKQILKGMDMVHRLLLDALKSEGLERIEAVGKEFDPNFHQAVMQVEDANFDSNIIIEEFQKGYILKDRVIRPTMVKVNQ